MPASTLCDDLCRKTSACQGNEPLVCVRQCESNAANVSAIGCGSELQAFLECMNANIVCKDGDFDALHVAEVLKMGLNDSTRTLDITYPEKQFVEPRKRDQKKSMIRAAVVTLAAMGLAAGALAWAKDRG